MRIANKGDILVRKGKSFEVICADGEYFIVVPMKQKGNEVRLNFRKPKIYSNDSSINYLSQLGFTFAFNVRQKH